MVGPDRKGRDIYDFTIDSSGDFSFNPNKPDAGSV